MLKILIYGNAQHGRLKGLFLPSHFKSYAYLSCHFSLRCCHRGKLTFRTKWPSQFCTGNKQYGNSETKEREATCRTKRTKEVIWERLRITEDFAKCQKVNWRNLQCRNHSISNLFLPHRGADVCVVNKRFAHLSNCFTHNATLINVSSGWMKNAACSRRDHELV